MASLPQPSLATTNKVSLCPKFFPKRTQITKFAKRNHYLGPRVVSCNAKNDDQNHTPGSKFDRRDVLIGIGGLYGATNLSHDDPFAMAAPVSAPDLTKCSKADLPAAAHLADKEYIAKYNQAIKLMKALPADDPPIFGDTKASIYDPLRDADHQPPTLLDLDYSVKDKSTTNQDLLASNLKVMYRQMISNGKNPTLFFGSAYKAGDDPDPGAGSIENIPHGGKKRKDITDPDWLNSAFLFYDENAQPVRVKVKDCLETTKLGYVYQKVDIPWLKTKPTPRKSKTKKVAKLFQLGGGGVGAAQAAESTGSTTGSVTFPIVLDKGFSFRRDEAVKFDVYINDEDDSPSGPDKTEFAGSFVNAPHKHNHNKKMNTTLRLGITDLLEDLDAEDDESVVVTLVPKYGKGVATIGGIKIQFVS
uniref:Polyphenol oxidase C-terminal domain-containing protein n=1 Tax=Fagus sylvatica TaxID=28930 RepID=A0A2N9GS95_FAGSY